MVENNANQTEPAKSDYAESLSASAIDTIRDLVANDMQAVNRTIEQRLHSDVVLVNQMGHYIVNSGGKRLRPVLVLLSARAHGYLGMQHIELAALVEFIHTATLLHDDVVDASDLRRGHETANHVWGNEASVLVGDFLYSRAFQMMVTVGDMHVMEILAEATNTIAEGEVMQLLNCHDPDTTEKRYLDTIQNKTAKLFEASARLGAVVCKAEQACEESIADYGKHLGTAFQLIDDALDYSATSDELGKNLGDDLAEGKPTLPLLYALWHGNETQQALIRKAIEQGGLDYIDEITRTILETGGIDYTVNLAKSEADKALSCLQHLPDGSYRDALASLARFSVSRSS